MTKLLLKLPWFLSAPAVALLAVAFAAAGYMYTGDYFHETCRNDRNLLTGEFEASNCGEGAKVAKRSAEPSSTAAAPQSQGADSTPGATNTAPAGGGVLATGQFRDGDPGHTGKGAAEVQRLPDGKLNLFLRDFSVTNGPDLFVYVVEKNGRDEDGLNLGELQANNGNQNYAIPAGTDLAKYERVVIWCRQFRVNFAFATLEHRSVDRLLAESTSSPATSVPATTAAPTTSASATAIPSATQPPAQPTPTPIPATPTPTPVPTGPGVLAVGNFRDGDPGHQGSGTAQVQRLANGSLNLFLSNFSVTNGPDLVVVLSTDPGGSRGSVSFGLTLDALKANNGNQNYAIPAGTDIASFKSVIIYCKAFPTVFAYATLEAY